jgi:hypothetical protein
MTATAKPCPAKPDDQENQRAEELVAKALAARIGLAPVA